MEENYYGQLKIPVLGITLEQLILILYPLFLIPAVFLWYTNLQKRRTVAVNPPGCIPLRQKGPSNMTDEYDSKYDAGTEDETQWRIKAIHIHPIKSCAPVELDEADIDSTGMTWDRKFAFAELLPQRASPNSASDSKTEEKQTLKWTFRTQRTPGFGKLALVRPEVWLPSSSTKSSSSSSSSSSDKNSILRISQTGALVVKYPNIPTGPLAFLDRFLIKKGMLPSTSSFTVPLTPPANHTYPKETINIWRDNPSWLNYSIHVPADFKAFLTGGNNNSHPLTLFRSDPSSHREVHRNSPTANQLGYQPAIGFADAYPLHILNLSSVHDVGRRITESIPHLSAKRFRSNFLLVGPTPYDEDDWKKIRISSSSSSSESHTFHCACHTVRCRLPNVDPDTGLRHPTEPDKTLKSYRCIDRGDANNACLGLQLVPAGIDGNEEKRGPKMTVKVGDRIQVLERGEHLYIKQ